MNEYIPIHRYESVHSENAKVKRQHFHRASVAMITKNPREGDIPSPKGIIQM
jgi:hypothetical protein